MKLNQYKEDVLFFMFYTSVGDVLQVAAAAELWVISGSPSKCSKWGGFGFLQLFSRVAVPYGGEGMDHSSPGHGVSRKDGQLWKRHILLLWRPELEKGKTITRVCCEDVNCFLLWVVLGCERISPGLQQARSAAQFGHVNTLGWFHDARFSRASLPRINKWKVYTL